MCHDTKCVAIQISLTVVRKGLCNIKPSMVQAITWNLKPMVTIYTDVHMYILIQGSNELTSKLERQSPDLTGVLLDVS